MRRRLLQLGYFGGMTNFVVFFLGALYLGGDAVNGRTVDGHYFLANKGHLTEVSHAVFMYSKCHTLSIFITHPLAILCAWRLNRQSKLSY